MVMRDTNARSEQASSSFEPQDQRALALVYSEAAQDPDFRADNDAIERDFAVLDQEVDSRCC